MKLSKLLTNVMVVAFSILLAIFFQTSNLGCPLCDLTIFQNTPYLWDIQTGAVFPVNDYLDGQSDCLWFDPVNELPQEHSITHQLGIARFPDPATCAYPNYCKQHTPASTDCRFLILSEQNGKCSTTPLITGQPIWIGGHKIVRQYAHFLEVWEIILYW